MKISGTYLVKKWDEKPYALIEGRMKATRASVEYAFSGDLEGTANVDYLMYYNSFDAKDRTSQMHSTLDYSESSGS